MSDQLFSEWCQDISQADKFIDQPLPPNPEVISATQAINWEPNFKQKDMRPRVYDGISKSHLLLDSGAAVTVVPAGPEDVVKKNLHLKTVNNQRIDCCGKKEINIRLGRKTYAIEAVVAKISQPIIGWDFIKHYKLNFVWNHFGDIMIQDPKAKISAALSYRAVPVEESFKLKNLAMVSHPRGHSGVAGPLAEELIAEIAAMQSLTPEKKKEITIEDLPDSEYKFLLRKFPDLLE